MKAGRRGALGMKGQMVMEFVIAALMLFGIMAYVMGNLMFNMGTRSSESGQDTLVSEAFAASDVLLRGGGSWTGSVPRMAGLSDGWPVLNATKVQYLQAYCAADYEGLAAEFGLGERHGISIRINETGVGEILSCGSRTPSAVHANVRRVALTEAGDVALVEVSVW
jgi:hypothetical protein